MKKILILGGNGFLGKNLAQKLSQSFDVLIGDAYILNCPFRCVEIRLNETEKLKTLLENEKTDIVINLVSTINPSSSMEEYEKDIEEVYKPTESLLKYLTEKNISYVYFSSGGAVYGNDEGLLDETHELNPLSYYGMSKKAMEEQTLRYGEKGLKYLIIRPSNPYGHGQNLYGKQGFIANTIGKIKKNIPIEIWGDGNNRKDYIYIEDFVYYVDALIKGEHYNEIFNIGSGVSTSLNEILSYFKEAYPDMPEVIYTPYHSSDVKNVMLECKKIKQLTDYRCLEMKEGIRRFLNEELG